MSESAISVQGLQFRYGARAALRGLDLEVPAGSFFALLGPNGAGKTTLLRCLVGMIRPTKGDVRVLGFALGPGYPPVELRTRMGYVAQQPALYEQMTVGEVIGLCRRLHPRWNAAAADSYLELFGLPRGYRVRHLSAGMRSQLALTVVMGGRPELLVLDEPTLGLDPLNRHLYMRVLLEDSLEAGCTVLLSSHDLHQIERMADHVAIINHGGVTLSGALDDLKLKEHRVRVAGDVMEAALAAARGVRRVVRESSGWLLYATGDPGELRGAIQSIPGVTAVQIYDQSLEEIFLSYVS